MAPGAGGHYPKSKCDRRDDRKCTVRQRCDHLPHNLTEILLSFGADSENEASGDIQLRKFGRVKLMLNFIKDTGGIEGEGGVVLRREVKGKVEVVCVAEREADSRRSTSISALFYICRFRHLLCH